MFDAFHFHDEVALLERLTTGLKRRTQEVVFLVGSPLSAPVAPEVRGIPGVEGVIDLIRQEFADDPSQTSALDSALEIAGEKRYQSAFFFLQGRRGQQTANEIIRKAVFQARNLSQELSEEQFLKLRATDEECRRLEFDTIGWTLSPGIENLGKLVAAYPDRFGRSLLTTNFDPLIEVAIRRAEGRFYRTTLHADGNLSQTEADGCHVIHLHGYWYGSDTLHTSRQLGQARPHLKDSLSGLLRNKLVGLLSQECD